MSENYIVHPSENITGEITVPGDKSISHRALILLSISEGTASISNFLESDDCIATANILKKLGVKSASIKDISKAVSNIRSRKLPNPEKIGNAGSFFKNPIVEKNQLDFLVKKFENIPYHRLDNNLFKIPAAWLIEKCGFKGKKFTNFGVSEKRQ